MLRKIRLKLIDMNIEINETEARHLTRLINRELTQFKSRQNVDSEIRLRQLLKKLKAN